ncbi:HEAT repeat domain-containing protein, partial [Candidatus Sumerlaeota bacterium]|nr:HEAT repeat domain-containing protein [Candidatus Sumerlaeota bacterium]
MAFLEKWCHSLLGYKLEMAHDFIKRNPYAKLRVAPLCIALAIFILEFNASGQTRMDCDEKPTEENVLKAVRNYVGKDVDSRKARACLAVWGAGALPALKSLATKPECKKDTLNILFGVSNIESEDAMKFMVEMAQGKTIIDKEEAVMILGAVIIGQPSQREILEDLPEFKTAVFALASSENWLCRQTVAQIIRNMHWSDGVPLLQPMLEDANLQVRDGAADAIEQFTGIRPPIKRPELSFPKSDLKTNLVEKLGTLPKSGWMTSAVSFTHWYDGSPGLLQWRKGELCVYGADLKIRAKVRIKKMMHDFLMMPYKGNQSQLVALVSDQRTPHAGYAMSFDISGKSLWEYHPTRAGVEALAPLYDASGKASSVILGFGGDEGILAAGLNGTILARAEKQYVLYDLQSDPSVPNQFVLCGGDISYFSFDGSSLKSSLPKTKIGVYASAMATFHDSDGHLAVVASGS